MIFEDLSQLRSTHVKPICISYCLNNNQSDRQGIVSFMAIGILEQIHK